MKRPRATPPRRRAAALLLALGLPIIFLPIRATARQVIPPPTSPQPGTPRGGSQPEREHTPGLPDAQPAKPDAPGRDEQPNVVAPPVPASLAPYENRLIREVRIVGLKKVGQQLVTNQIGSKPGQPLSIQTVEHDIQKLNRLGRFRKIEAKVQSFDDQSIALIYEFEETPIIEDVQAVGNRQISDQDIAAEVNLLKGTPVDHYQLDRARRRIQELYRKKGYYQSEVTIDEAELEKRGYVVFKIREGERIKVTDIRFEPFEGKLSFTEDQLGPNIKTKTAGIFETGPLDDETLDQDVASIIGYYQDHGYLDVRVGKRVQTAPNGREAIVSFIIREGSVYTLRSVRVELDVGGGEPSGKPPTVFTQAQIAGLMKIKAGDVYSLDKIRKSVSAIQDAYGQMGYVDAKVGRAEPRAITEPQVDLLLLVSEGRRFTTGLNIIHSGDITQQHVIRRQVLTKPERPLDTTAMRETKTRIEETKLFEPGSVKLTIQPEDPERPGFRDVLIECKETNTGSLTFGAAVTSDAGLVGQISLTQRNFDITDFPDSWGELISNRAFRGGGQTFDITLLPGSETQQYSISLADPAIFDTDYAANGSGYYFVRQYDQYDEYRLGTLFGVGRRFGERWTAGLAVRAVNVELRNIDADAPVDVFNSAGPDVLTGIRLNLSRFTSDSRTRPTNGTKFDVGVEQVGALGGDLNFTKLDAAYSVYLPIYESFLGRKTVLSLNTRVAYIPQNENEVPVYERYYLGGNSFRGFDFRTISPKGIRHDTMTLGNDPVGGTWSFFAGAEVEQPLWEDILSGVVFLDTGTVTNDPGFDDYRVSAGFGVRIRIPALGPLPLAFDFGFPLVKHFGDKERVFSFTIDIPFRN